MTEVEQAIAEERRLCWRAVKAEADDYRGAASDALEAGDSERHAKLMYAAGALQQAANAIKERGKWT
jgi:hypothetical protein